LKRLIYQWKALGTFLKNARSSIKKMLKIQKEVATTQYWRLNHSGCQLQTIEGKNILTLQDERLSTRTTKVRRLFDI
jgi:hypothetical protein